MLELAVMFEGPGDEYDAKAKQVAKQLSVADTHLFQSCFYPIQEIPAGYRDRYNTIGRPELTDWSVAWLWSFIVVLYEFKERGLPALNRIAFGEYDLPQSMAISAMCRLAVEGVARDKIAGDLARHFGSMRNETQVGCLGSVLDLAVLSPRLMKAYKGHIVACGTDYPMEAIEFLEPLADRAPEEACDLVHLLRHIMCEDRLPADNFAEEDSPPASESIPTYSAMDAARLINVLVPGDREASGNLSRWVTHPDDEIRQFYQQWLDWRAEYASNHY